MTNKTTANSRKNSGKNVKFEINEKVLCYQESHIYEAKCLNIRHRMDHGVEYLVHYCGYKSKYDEWVPPNRVLKFNKENLQLKQQLRQTLKKKGKFKKSKKDKQRSDSVGKEKSSTIKNDKLKKSDSLESSNSNSNVNPILKNLDSTNIDIPPFVETQEDFLNKHEVKIRLPEELKTILTDDWNSIITQKKLIHLPFGMNIDKILNEYLYTKSQTCKLPSQHTMDGYKEFLTNIRLYFNYFLDKCLLYPSERSQMEYLIKHYDEFTSEKFMKSNDPKDIMKRLKSKKNNNNNNKNNLENFIGERSVSVLNGGGGGGGGGENQPKAPPSPMISDQNSPSGTSDSCSSEVFMENIHPLPPQPPPPNNTSHIMADSEKAATPSTSSSANETKKIDFTKLYGAVHLLRLFTKLGQFLFYSDLNAERLSLLNSYICDFLKYLSKNVWLFFNESDTSYVDASLFINK